MKADLRQRAFLAAYRVTASITRAAEAVKMERDLHYRWLKDSKIYRDDFEAAREEAAQTLEDEATRRAHEGVVEPNVFKGRFCYAAEDYVKDEETGEATLREGAQPLGVRKYSDTLLTFLLKGMRPDKYRDNWRGELVAQVSAELKLEAKKLEALNDDELARLIEIAGKLTSADADAGGTKAPVAK